MSRPHCLNLHACTARGAGHCRKCANTHKNASTEMREVAAENMRRKHRDPAFRARNDAAAPLRRQRLREFYGNAENRARLAAVSVIGRAKSIVIRTQPAWCPPEFLPLYRELTGKHRIRAKEARRIVEAEIPGTREHARVQIANSAAAMRLKHEREQREAY